MAELCGQYHISDRLDDHNDGDDEGRSKAFPSRTSWGASWHCGGSSQGGPRIPYLSEPRRFFFGLIEVTCWGYRCGLTHAQIELLLADSPVVDYNTGKKHKGEKTDYKNKSIADKAADALRRLEESKLDGSDKLESLNINGVKINI